MHLNHKDQLHLIGSGKKNKKGSTSAAAATSSDNIKIAAKVEQEHFYAVWRLFPWLDFEIWVLGLVNFVFVCWLCPLTQGNLAQSGRKLSPNLTPVSPNLLMTKICLPLLQSV